MIKTDALIIGSGPTGLFTAHQLKLIGLSCEVVDNLDKIGGQCIELYPDKPIYDIPAVPECTGEELTNNLKELKKDVKISEIKCFLSNEADSLDCYIEIHAGAGGTESQDWANMLRKMYLKWAENKKFKFDLISEHKGDEAGIKSSKIKIPS